MMRRMTLLHWLLLGPALVLFLLFAGVSVLILSAAPPLVGVVSCGVVAVVALWFFFARRRGSGPVSEAGYLGQRFSKDGLL